MFNSNASSAAGDANFVEDVFSTYLYTGNSTITNGIDLAGEGGLVWVKGRSGPGSVGDHCWIDTVRGANLSIASNLADGNYSISGGGNTPPTFTATGFTTGDFAALGAGSTAYASWTFREQTKFFDVVTYTGTGSAQNIAHNLGSVPGCIIVKRTDGIASWRVYHRSLGATKSLLLNATNAEITDSAIWNNTEPTSTVFTVNTSNNVNASGGTYVAYLYAHNAGGFGLTGTDNVISCGGFTTTASADTITLGYEPQWVLAKAANSVTNWYIFDNMRGIPTGGLDLGLKPNSSAAESADANFIDLTATGFISNFQAVFGSGIDIIYIAIRRGPMKVPTDGTSVYYPQAYADSSLGTNNPTLLGASAGFPTDFFMHSIRSGDTFCADIFDRLRGSINSLMTSDVAAESTSGQLNGFDNAFDIMTGVKAKLNDRYYGTIGRDHIGWFLRRAPGFFDEVCYTGTGSATNVTHNLGAVPELMIVKQRDTTRSWVVYSAALGATKFLTLQTTNAESALSAIWNDTSPTSTVFTVGTSTASNQSGGTYVAYLFASAPGVSKVGSYTGTATTLQINCGFTSGARFVLIKRTDSTGDWYVWDSARGIVAGNDPYLLLNSTAAEVTGTDYVDTYSAGFELTSTAPAALNASGGTYIFLAIA